MFVRPHQGDITVVVFCNTLIRSQTAFIPRTITGIANSFPQQDHIITLISTGLLVC